MQSRSAVSWSAIIAGAFVAVSVSLILLALGSGLSFASMSPWAGQGASASALTAGGAVWLIVMQWVSACFGGYIAGRLRTRWVGTHVHEVFFRDTAHGFVTWAVATVVVALLAAGSLSSLIGGGVHALTTVAGEGAKGAVASAASPGAAAEGGSSPGAYAVDKLFRAVPGSSASPSDGSDSRAEVARIVATDAAAGAFPEADRSYLAEQVAARTGRSEADAQRAVDDLIAQTMAAGVKAKAAVDAARKSAAKASIYTALSLLVGAFIASVSAALGGRLRDEHP